MENNLIEEFKEYSDKVTATKESSQEFLQNVGIIDNDGNITEQYGGPVKFDYTGLDTTSPVRFDGETYEQYKLRRKIVNGVFKRRLKGQVIHQSREHLYTKQEDKEIFLGLGRGLTYTKKEENESTT